MKLRRMAHAVSGEPYGYAFHCPGCDDVHTVGLTWKFNGDLEKPTFSPSILVTYFEDETVKERCHSFVRDGQIQFLSDCTHALASQTVELPEWK